MLEISKYIYMFVLVLASEEIFLRFIVHVVGKVASIMLNDSTFYSNCGSSVYMYL